MLRQALMFTEFQLRYARFIAGLKMIDRVQRDLPVAAEFLETMAATELAAREAERVYQELWVRGQYVRWLTQLCSCGHPISTHNAVGWCLQRDAAGWICKCIELDMP